MKSKKWIYIPIIIVVLVVALLLLPFEEMFPIANNNTNTTTAATTATVKDEPLATETSTEMTDTTTTITANTSSLDEIKTTTTQGGSTSTTKETSAAKTTAKKTEATKTTGTKATSGKKDYLDISQLTGTQEDVGKVVGYSSWLGQDITVVSVTEKVNGTGVRGVEILLSDYTMTCIVECVYCHEMPCPEGGGEQCSQYDVKFDVTKTCSLCGRPRGDGHNGTCYRTTDWDNGGIHTCHHYD